MDPPSIVKEECNSVEFESVILSKVTGFWQKTEKVKIITGVRKRSLEVLFERQSGLHNQNLIFQKGMRGEMRRGRGMSKYWEDEEG